MSGLKGRILPERNEDKMLKIIGSMMIGISCIWLGLRRSMGFRKRYRSLQEIQNSLSVLETEIAFRETELKQAFSNTANPLFCEAAKTIERDGIQNAWKRAVKKCAPRMGLTDGDKDTLHMLGQRLGMTDTENQIKNIDGVKNMLDIHIQAARYDVNHFCRLYTGGGVLTGIFLILMLL